MEGREVSQTEVEIVPLTDDQIAAIKDLRFVWTNMNHTIAWGLTTDESVAMRCPGGMWRSSSRSKNQLPLERRHQIGIAGRMTP
jgi:hypothetical protein